MMSGIEIMLTTMVTVLVGTLLIAWIASVVAGWIDAFRYRYTSDKTSLKAIDILGVPTWLVLEISWFVMGLFVSLVTAFFAYEAAKSVRDWWHAGDRHKH